MPDVERLTRKLERRKASLSDLCQLYRASSKLPMIQNALLDHPGPHAALLKTRSALMCYLTSSLAIALCTSVAHFDKHHTGVCTWKAWNMKLYA